MISKILDAALHRYRLTMGILVVALVMTVANLAYSLRPNRVLVTLKPGRFGQVVGFTDEETARSFELLTIGLEISLERGLTGEPPLATIHDFVAFTAPCTVHLEAGTQARLGLPAEIARHAFWCSILDGAYAGKTLLIPVLEIDHEDVRDLWPPKRSPKVQAVAFQPSSGECPSLDYYPGPWGGGDDPPPGGGGSGTPPPNLPPGDGEG